MPLINILGSMLDGGSDLALAMDWSVGHVGGRDIHGGEWGNGGNLWRIIPQEPSPDFET